MFILHRRDMENTIIQFISFCSNILFAQHTYYRDSIVNDQLKIE